jgi:hypothetical protein
MVPSRFERGLIAVGLRDDAEAMLSAQHRRQGFSHLSRLNRNQDRRFWAFPRRKLGYRSR